MWKNIVNRKGYL